MARKIIVSVVVCFCILGVAFIGVYKLIEKKVQTLPVNNPVAFLQQGQDAKKKVLVCIGDSITHGTVSVNYVDMLSSRLANRGIVVVNAGVNSELAYNVAQRLDAIVSLQARLHHYPDRNQRCRRLAEPEELPAVYQGNEASAIPIA